MTGYSEGRVNIARWRAEYIVSADVPNASGLRGELDAIALERLPATLSAILERALPASDESVWCIRSLRVDADFDTAMDSDAIAKAWAGQVVVSLARTLAEEDGDGVLRFANRAAYLAAFLADLAANSAWDAWYYGSFNGLRTLPLSAAMRTALCDDPACGREALSRIPAAKMGATLAALSESDAGRALDALSTGADAEDGLDRAHACRALDFGVPPEWATRRAALRVFAAACRDGAAPGPALKRASLAAVRCAQLLDRPDADHIAEMLRTRNLAAIFQLLGAADGELLAPVIRHPEEWIAAVSARAAATASTGADVRVTPFGGAFLLLPVLDSVPIAGGAPVRFLVLLKCLGGERALHAFADPVLRGVMGIDGAATAADARAWQQAMESLDPAPLHDISGEQLARYLAYTEFPAELRGPARADFALDAWATEVLRRFARKLPGFANTPPAHLFTNFLDFRARIADEGARQTVRMCRPPLAVILNMTGLSRFEYELSWLTGRKFALFSED